jgi:Domain of unknown function (DUF5916)
MKMTKMLSCGMIRTRTIQGGPGIGVFNAVTNSMWAEGRDTMTGAVRHIMTEPVTNYNIVVLDQTLRGRHYWSMADYDGDYYTLQQDGGLIPRVFSTTVSNSVVNTNFLNIDLVYTWRFAPGSELSLVWKNAIYSEGETIIRNSLDNFDDLLSQPQTNSISLKILYYLDYQNFRRLFLPK